MITFPFLEKIVVGDDQSRLEIGNPIAPHEEVPIFQRIDLPMTEKKKSLK